MKLRTLLISFFCLLVGSTIGAGAFVFYYSEGYAYLSDNPKTCTNCHVMQDVYDRWEKSSHHHVASCNSCHAAGNFFEKYYGKARSGFLHSYAFTVGYQEPIQIKDFNRQITEKACRTCHADFIKSSHFENAQDNSCIRCHSQVGHLGK
jgi:cytochrome c nitrite reductase small subunit